MNNNIHVLIIGGGRDIYPYLLREKYEFSLIIKRDELRPSDVKMGFRAIFTIDSNNSLGECIKIVENLNQLLKIDRVISFHDSYQILASLIANHLRLEFQFEANLVELTRNKFKTRQILRNANLSNTKSCIVNNESDIEKFLFEFGYPAILKPIDAAASRGVSKIVSKSEIKKSIRWAKSAGRDFPYTIEQFIEGEELSVESISINGCHFILAITKKYIDKKTHVEKGHLIPAPLSRDQEAEIEKYIQNVLTALGFKNGPSHTEIFYTERGPEIIETHTRIGGDHIAELVKLATGVEYSKIVADQALGFPINTNKLRLGNNKLNAVSWFKFPTSKKGIVKELNGLRNVHNIKGIKKAQFHCEPGDIITDVKHSFNRVASVISTSKNKDVAIKNAQSATIKMKVHVE